MKKTILISGAGSGIGQSIAKIIAEMNYSVILLGRNRQSLETTQVSLKQPKNHSIITADIRDSQAIQIELQKLDPILDGIVANAGLGGENHYGKKDRWNEVIDTNLTGTYQLVQESLPYFVTKEKGFRHIIIISSILARLGVPGYSAYCASKAGLLGLMRSWAAEFASEKILVNAICPGWVNTDMATQGLKTFAQNTGKSYENILQEEMGRVLLGKMSEPEEIANLVKFLVSQEQSSITGQTIDINNGALMPT
jgi:NAD(P)-dependent dehydrogenase (short-subunit alcohol dehydrogenase family)